MFLTGWVQGHRIRPGVGAQTGCAACYPHRTSTFDGNQWWTRGSFLLQGNRRQYLLYKQRRKGTEEVLMCGYSLRVQGNIHLAGLLLGCRVQSMCWDKFCSGTRLPSCSFPHQSAKKSESRGKGDPQARPASKRTIVCLFKIFPSVSPWHGFPWLNKSLQTPSLALHTSVWRQGSHRRRQRCSPSLPAKCSATLLQHTAGRACSGSHEPHQWAVWGLRSPSPDTFSLNNGPHKHTTPMPLL